MFASYQQWYYQGLAGTTITHQAVGFDHIKHLIPYFSKKVNDFTCQARYQTAHHLLGIDVVMKLIGN